MAPYAAFAAVVTQNTQLMDKILADQHQVLALENLDDVFQAYRDSMDGKTIDPTPFLGDGRTWTFAMMWKFLLVAYCDARAGLSTHHSRITEDLYSAPINRLVWIAEDDYQRRDPSKDAPAFYDYLDWMFGNDPWVAKAVADFHQRGGSTDEPINALFLRVDLERALHDAPAKTSIDEQDWTHVITPWRVVACVHQLITQHNLASAARVASKYRDVESMGTFNDARRNVACELLHRVNLLQNSPAAN
jgi:hypothetical protein